MYKYNIRIFSLIFVVFLLTSCDEYHCIEANDTGEYNTTALTLASKSSICEWDPEDGEFGNASSEVSKIASNNKYSLTVNSCTINNVSCQTLKDCINNSSDNIGTCLTNDSATLESCSNISLSTYLAFYNQCMDKSLTECETQHADALETIWYDNSSIDDYNAAVFGLNGYFIVQASDSIILTNSQEKSVTFTAKNNQLQFIPQSPTEPFILTYPIKFNLSGAWCKGGNKDTCNVYDNQMGKVGNVWNNAKHIVINNFLRRGVVVLKGLPDGGYLDANNNYIGPMIQPDFSGWTCEKPNISTNDINAIDENFYTCYTGYAESEFLEKNNELYPIETTFQKDVGGFVVPNNVLEYITPADPYANASCTTNQTRRMCFDGETRLDTWVKIKEQYTDNSSNASANDVNKEIMYNTILLDTTGLDKDFLYPNKVAFKIIGNTNNKSISGTCNVTIQVTGDNSSLYTMSVKADNRWHFLTDSNNNFITLNKNNYNTLISTSIKNQSFNSNNFYNVKINVSGTWNDEDGNEIPCGEGMAVFFMPQNEILINKSGFVSFKNLFAPVNSCDNILYSSTNYTCVDNVNELYFTIINPMYNIKDNTNSTALVRENFYEYIKDNNYNSPVEKVVGVSLTNNNWTPKTFVRKGQILRFDEKSWYDIIPLAGGGYDIKSKIMPLGSGIYKSVSHGLVLKIEERPALFCDGFETEEISFYNSENEIETGGYSLIQCYDLEEYIGSYRKLREGNDTNDLAAIKEYGKLNANDITLGAKKLSNIFDENNGYGNFDTIYYNPDDNSNTYTSNFSIPVNYESILTFLVIDNSDFNFNYNSSYNDGSYTLDFSPTRYFTNGEQIAVALADKDWDGNDPNQEPISWLIKYNTDSNSENYGQIDPSSTYEFDSNGRLVKKGSNNYQITLNSTNFPGLSSVPIENVRLFFKIVDLYEVCTNGDDANKRGVTIDEVLCKCSNESGDDMYRSCSSVSCDDSSTIEQKMFTRCSTNLTANNSGNYKVQISVDNGDETGWLESGLSNLLMAPIFEIFDGKYVQLTVDNNNIPVPCDSTAEKSGDCYIYYNYEDGGYHYGDVGDECIMGQYGCYKSCKRLTMDQHNAFCRTFNSGTGFVERFYKNIIQDKTYNRIITTCFALMFSFYGLYFLLGLAEFNQEELIKKLIKISFIYLMISDIGWSIYRDTFVAFFKNGIDYVTYSIVNSFTDDANLTTAIDKNFYSDKSIIFSNINSSIHFIFNDKTQARIGSIFFTNGFAGPVLWLLMWIAVVLFLISVITAMVLYTVSQVFVSFFLGFGPVFFVFLIFDRTKGMFDKWLSNLIGFSFEQIFLLTCASLFNGIILSILKGIFSYKVCYEPIFRIEVMNMRLNLITFWKPANVNEIPGLSQILLIFLLAYLSKNFLKFMANLGSGIGGAEMSSSSVGSAMVDSTTAVLKPLTDKGKEWGKKGLKWVGKGVGYHTREDIDKYNEEAKTIIKEKNNVAALASSDTEGDVREYFGLKEGEKIDMSDPEVAAKWNEFYKQNLEQRAKENPELIKALKNRNMTIEEAINTEDYKFFKSASMLGEGAYRARYGKNSTDKYLIKPKEANVGSDSTPDTTGEKSDSTEDSVIGDDKYNDILRKAGTFKNRKGADNNSEEGASDAAKGSDTNDETAPKN